MRRKQCSEPLHVARMLMVEQAGQHLDLVLSILVQHASVFLPVTHEVEARQEQDTAVDIRTDEDFWTVVRRALVGSSSDEYHL